MFDIPKHSAKRGWGLCANTKKLGVKIQKYWAKMKNNWSKSENMSGQNKIMKS